MRLAIGVTAGAVSGAVAATLLLRRGATPATATTQLVTVEQPGKFAASEELATCDSLTASGTLLVCTQNLAVSGANQVALNLVEGNVWRGHVVCLSPSHGPFAKEFADLGVSVMVGSLEECLKRVPDVRLAICNTIMTAHLVVALGERRIPSMWILHEWWPGEMLTDELTKRNDRNTTPEVVKRALETCERTVCVCKSQCELYKPKHGAVTFVGVPEPDPDWKISPVPVKPTSAKVTFLCLGIVCPRKNQHMAVQVFKQCFGKRSDVRLLVVGARYIRQYEIDYVDKVKSVIDNDPRIELHEVTNDVDQFYRQSDALLFTSLNEVTPMVIAEAMMRSLPVITTNIAGIPEMLAHGVHGYVLDPEQPAQFVEALDQLGGTDAAGQRRRLQMGAAARKHALDTFTNVAMVSEYRGAALCMSSPVVLVDMDGVLVDWDRGFATAWGGASPIDRSKSYAMEECVPAAHKSAAVATFHAPGFFLGLPPMAGAVRALQSMLAKGYRIFLCTSPVLSSRYCAGEKFEWVRKHLGDGWVGRIILTSDKTSVRGDVLIDDKPKIVGAHHPVWQQLLFDAPYNLHLPTAHRLSDWANAEKAITSLLCSGPRPAHAVSATKIATAEAEGGGGSGGGISKSAVAALPDFSHLLPPDYRKDYAAWRSGRPQGAKGELSDAITRMEAMQDSVLNNTSEDFSEVHVYRKGYSSWRRGRASGAKGTITQM